MKKLLLTSAAVCGLALAATPAYAQVELDVGGFAKLYGAVTDHDEVSGGLESNDVDFIRDTEVYLSGQTTLDNGLTVGAHMELQADATSNNDNFEVDESYLFFSGNWGRVNVGAEDGAAYLLQVAAPSADANIDGIRQDVNPVNFAVLQNDATIGDFRLDYSHDNDEDLNGRSDKITYLTPVVSGLQLGATFTPDSDAGADDLAGVGRDNEEDTFGAGYEVAARYEGQFDNVGFILGAGYSTRELEANTAVAATQATDDRDVFNVGLDLDIGPIGVGLVYVEDNNGDISTGAAGSPTVDDQEIMVLGVDYTTGNYKFGASYYDSENANGVQDLDITRYSVGASYTYGPGMTFNGSIGFLEADNLAVTGVTGAQDVEATYFVLGTQVNF